VTSAPTAVRRVGAHTKAPDQHERTFRPDIEGLRAIAVGTVLIYHAGLPFFHGGFIGVDVFFVISGFLITGLLVAEIERTGRLSISGFYARRIKRLLPATMVVLLTTVALSWMFLSPLRRLSTAGDVAASALYVVNWRLAGQAVDYLAQGEDPSPVQHFWSLAVEEQFYVLWPLLLIVAALVVRRRGWGLRPTLLAFIVALSVPSFIYSLHLTHSQPGAAYFSSLTRAWELGVGAALAIVAPWLFRLPSVFSRVLGWAGVAAILWAAISFTDATPFPGRAALWPVLGAAAVIAAGVTAGRNGPVRLLGTPAMMHVGRISYSWYLWHWPLLVIAAAIWGHLSAWQGLLVLAFSYIPTRLSTRYVEDPFRRSKVLVEFPKRAFGLAAVTMSSVLIAAFLLHASVPAAPKLAAADLQGAAALDSPATNPTVTGPSATGSTTPSASSAADSVPKTPRAELIRPAAFTPSALAARKDLPQIYADGCHRDETSVSVSGCVYGDPNGKVTVALLGDSHAAQWFPPLQQIAVARHWRLIVETKSGCTPASVLVYNFGLLKRAYTECSTWRAAALARLVEVKPQLVVTSGSFGNTVVQNGKKLPKGASIAATTAGMTKTLKQLTHAGAKVLVLRDTPRPGFDVPDCVSSAGQSLAKCAAGRTVAMSGASTGVEEAAVNLVKDTGYVDLDASVCPSDPCAPIIGNVLVYRDTDHMTATYAATLRPILTKAIDSFF
jgi:peptidoglycan/LPS O-acetylase OafA/YrhL